MCAALTCMHMLPAGCQPYLGSWKEGLPACNMSEQAYMEGDWRYMQEHCRPQSLYDLGVREYAYHTYCNPAHHICTSETDTCRGKVERVGSYEWHPHKCNLQAFDPWQIDKKLGGRNVLFAGDSIMLQQFYSWKRLMGGAIKGSSPTLWNKFQTHNRGHHEVIAAQFLVGVPCCNHFQDQSLEVLPDAEWLHLARHADILILNTGHHLHRRDPGFEHYHSVVRNVLTTLKAEFRGSHIIFRTSTWGHHKCDTVTRPSHNLSEAMNFMENDPYSWMLPVYAEHIWADVAHEVGLGNKFRFVNSSMTLLRGDGHIDRQMDLDGSSFNDCLHYCMPGVPDFWNWALFNSLMSLDLN